MQLAANWPDKLSRMSGISPLIDLEPRAIGQQGASEKSQRERLSEETLQLSWVNKRSDSPNPGQIFHAIQLWKQGKVLKQISNEVGVAKRTLQRYLTQLGYFRNYDFVSEKLREYKKTEQHRKNISDARKIKGSARGEKNPRRDFPHLTFDLLNGITLCKKCHDKTRLKEYLSINIWKQRVQHKNP